MDMASSKFPGWRNPISKSRGAILSLVSDAFYVLCFNSEEIRFYIIQARRKRTTISCQVFFYLWRSIKKKKGFIMWL